MPRRKLAWQIVLTVIVGTIVPAAHVSQAQTTVQAVQWTNLVNAAATGSALQKSGGCGGCADAGGTSVQALAGDGYAEFTPAFGARMYAGLGATATVSTDPALIDFGFSFWPDGGWDVRERNIYRAEGRFAAGDVFRVALSGGTITYYQNGALLYTSGVAPTLPLVFDAALVDVGSGIVSASITSSVRQVEPVIVLTTTLANGAVSTPYSAALAAAGGSGVYAWSVAAGSLPNGLTLSAAGQITGTPSAPGTFAFTARATDAADAALYDDQALAIHVPATAAGLNITTTSVPSAHLDAAYAALLAASGGSGSYAWTIVSGRLPDGLTLNSASGAIAGTPTATGRFTVTVRASDVTGAASADDQQLTLAVLAALPPATYDGISDRVVRAKGPVEPLGPAGFRFTDPIFGSRLVRITDAATRPGLPGVSYRTPSGTHTNAWSVDGRYFYATSTDGTLLPYAFDAATMTASRLSASNTGDGGMTLRFYNEPTFSYLTPGVLYGTYNGSGSNLRSIDQLDIESGVYQQLLNLDSLAPNLAGTYTGGLGSSAGPTEKLFAFFGGIRQDLHFYLVVFAKDDPASRLLLDTTASTVNGVPTNITLNFRIHAAAIDRSGRYVTVYPTGADLAAPRSAAPAYIWDTATNLFTATPLVETRSGGHDAYGYGYRVNQDCCTTTTWDAAQWQLRSLATPLVTADLVTPVLLPKEVYLADHPSWHNAQPLTMVPFLDGTYRYGANTTEWRAWDDEIIAVQTEAAGTGAIVWRFAHHRSNVAHDSDATRMSFWYTPRVNVSPDGRWALFTSNWDKTLGTDPRGDFGGTSRQDLFLVELSAAAAPLPPAPVAVETASLPNGLESQAYVATLQATGGSGRYTWSVVAGSLPAGLALDSTTGVISGIASSPGTAAFTVRAADASDAANAAQRELTLTVTATTASAVNITTTILPGAMRDRPYSAILTVAGGHAPFTWSLAAGSLPPGLTLNAATGTISGTARETGTWSFSVRVVDSASPSAADTQALSIRVRRR